MNVGDIIVIGDKYANGCYYSSIVGEYAKIVEFSPYKNFLVVELIRSSHSDLKTRWHIHIEDAISPHKHTNEESTVFLRKD